MDTLPKIQPRKLSCQSKGTPSKLHVLKERLGLRTLDSSQNSYQSKNRVLCHKRAPERESRKNTQIANPTFTKQYYKARDRKSQVRQKRFLRENALREGHSIYQNFREPFQKASVPPSIRTTHLKYAYSIFKRPKNTKGNTEKGVHTQYSLKRLYNGRIGLNSSTLLPAQTTQCKI